MAMVKCPECGREVSEQVPVCQYCGKPIKSEPKEKNKSKKGVILFVLIPIIILMLSTLFIFCLYKSYWSMGNLKKIIGTGSFRCLLSEHDYSEPTCVDYSQCKHCGIIHGDLIAHDYNEATCRKAKMCRMCGKTEGEALGHTWIEATCTAGKTCSRCSQTEGEALGHIWVEATCTAGKTCSRCSQIEGSALGHTTEFGKCSRCNQYVKNLIDIFDNILKDITDATKNVIKGIQYASQTEDSYFGYYCLYTVSQMDFDFAENAINSAIENCGNYKEFSKIKSDLIVWKNAIPDDCKNDTKNEILQYSNSIKNLLDTTKEFSDRFEQEMHEMLPDDSFK